MATDAAIGKGTVIRIASPESPLDFVALAEVTKVTPPPLARDTPDASHMESPDQWREVVPGMRQGVDMPIELNFIPGSPTDARLRDMLTDEEPSRVEIAFPNGSVLSFRAWGMEYEPDDPVDDKMTATATLRVSGRMTFSADGSYVPSLQFNDPRNSQYVVLLF